VHDVRFALRTLRKNPGFTVAIVLLLALATGATTAIFSIVDSVLLRPLPFASPDRLVQVFEIWPVGGAGGVFYEDVEAFRREARSFEAFTGYGLTTRHLEGADGTERLTAVMTDRDFFAVLGAQPIAGRTFRGDDHGQLAVISARVWTRLFGRDPSVIGTTLALGGNVFDAALQRTVIERRRFTVLGVMSDAFQFPYAAGSVYLTTLPESQTDIWLFDEGQRRAGRFSVTARLKAGVSIDAAHAELTTIEARMDEIVPQKQRANRATAVRLEPLAETVIGSV
jgi:putative ABC transport system permease protein